MYRQVIEHPEWIPEAWQQSLDLYAGSDRGRIYALHSREDLAPRAVTNLDSLSSRQLVQQLLKANVWRRDTAQRLLLVRGCENPELIAEISEPLKDLMNAAHVPTQTRIQTMWTLFLLAPSNWMCRNCWTMAILILLST